MLDIDEGGEASQLLSLGDYGEGEGGFPGGFRTKDFHDAAAGKAAGTEGAVDQEIAGGDDFDVHFPVFPEAHDGAVAEVLVDLLEGGVEVFGAGGGDTVFSGGGSGGGFGFFGRHDGKIGGWVIKRG